ncbi:hypothetical protein QTH97_33360 [Variovorax sp. J22R24]|nr:hypothetical protein [Variovorax sp. J22R24]MDM0109844.1 hypothetical protein [Variovorax sp. J22R24]
MNATTYGLDVGVIVLMVQIDTVSAKNYMRDNDLRMPVSAQTSPSVSC